MSEQIITQPTSINDLQPKMCLEGKVTRTEIYGAFIDLGLERDGLVHISHLAPKRVKKVTDKVQVGDEIKVWVLSVDPDKGRIALTMVEPPEVDWDELEIGKVYSGKVSRIERYGVFVDIGAERPGLLHAREMGAYVRNPADHVRLGETLDVKVSNIDRRKRQIDFTMDLGTADVAADGGDEPPMLSPMEVAFRQANLDADKERRRQRSRRSKSSRNELDDIYQRTLNRR